MHQMSPTEAYWQARTPKAPKRMSPGEGDLGLTSRPGQHNLYLELAAPGDPVTQPSSGAPWGTIAEYVSAN